MEDYIIEYHEVTTENNQYPALTSSRKGIFLQTEYFAGNQIASDDNTGYNIVPYGYFTYRHMSDDEIFHFNINDIVENGIVSTLYPVFTTNDKLDSRYLQYQLNYGYEFARFAVLQKQGGSRTYMYLSKLKQLSLTMPKDVEEQKKISGFLMELDNLITLQQRKCDKLVNVKKSMLEKMFAREGAKVPEIRFEGFTDDWEQRKLGECFTERKDSMPEGELISVTIGEGIKKFSELGRHDNSNDDKSKYKKVCVGDIAYNSMRMWQGASGYSPYEGIVSPAYTVLSPITDVVDSKCISYLFKRSDMTHVFQMNSQGITSDNWNLKYPALSEIEIMVSPYLAEQHKIAAYLSRIDNLITLQQRKFSDLVLIERGGSPRPIDDYITDLPDGLNWVKIGDAPSQGRYITKTAEKIKPEGLSKTRQVQPGDLILSNSMSFGKPYIMGINGCIHDGWLLIRDTQNRFDLKFLCHMLGTDQMLNQYRMFAAGSTVNNLNKELVGNTTVSLPSVGEQRVIGEYLESVDDLITLQQCKS